MASALALLSATPNRLTYIWTTDAAGSQTASRTKAEMLADAATALGGRSAMLEFITPKTGADWVAMDDGNPAGLHVHVRGSTNGVCFQASFGTAPGEQLNVTGQAGGGAITADSVAIVEFAFYTTPSR